VTNANSEHEDDRTAEHDRRTAADHLVAVVGFDGTEPALRALDAAARLIAGRDGFLRVVFVGHVSAGAVMAPDALGVVSQGLDDEEQTIREQVRVRLDEVDDRWNFDRRDGGIAHELIAAAVQVQDKFGPETTVVIVVGSAEQAHHRIIGSVPVNLVRHANFPVVVVP
jgi:nucleotide-binding universal stress UspA family protein